MKAPSNLNPIQSETFVLTAAAPKNPLSIFGEFVIVVSCDESIEVGFNQSSSFIPLGQNGRYRMPLGPDGRRMTFDQIEFRRKAGAVVASNNVAVIIGSGDYDTGQVQIAANVTEQRATALSAPAVDVVLVAATNTLIAAANSARRCIRITNTGAADARLSSTAAQLSATRGELLRPGEAREIFVTGEIWARSTGTPTLNVAEEVF